MAASAGSTRFALGTFSFAGCTPFAGLVIDPSSGREHVIAVEALKSIASQGGHTITDAASVLGLLEQWSINLPALQAAADALAGKADAASPAAGVAPVPMASLKVHPPVAARQIFMSGANYFKHVVDLIVDQGPGANPDTEGMDPVRLREFAEALMRQRQKEGSPYIFVKPATVLAGPFDSLEVPPWATKPDWELELAVVIGKAARHVKRADAMAHVAGYTIGNDISNRDWIYTKADMKALGTDWVSSKCLPGYLPLGPFIVPSAHAGDPQNLQITLALNGEVKQNESTSDMIFDVARLVEHISGVVRLLPGDVICTGSPAGNGTHYKRFLQPGDVMDASITGLGAQRVPVIAERS